MSEQLASAYADLTRAELAVLVPELLLIGHLIDRSGMAWCIEALGREGMADVAIDEWMAASPIYTPRMQQALRYQGDDVVTIFKGLQLDIGAPPQFMDFRYTVHDRWHGEFHLDHCGALMDVEPMGEDYVVSMCHDIEDPTFDATAVATNPKAQIRPIHRPPRTPADRHPHCAWTVTIDESHPPVTDSQGCREVRRSVAAGVELDPIDPVGEGAADYAGPLLSDVDFRAFSHSALVRMADEVCLQMHLLNLGFLYGLRRRLPEDDVRRIARKQLVGIAGTGRRPAPRGSRHPAFRRRQRTSPRPPPGAQPARLRRGRRCHRRRLAVARRRARRRTRDHEPRPRGRARGGAGDPDEHRRRLRVRAAALAADHPGLASRVAHPCALRGTQHASAPPPCHAHTLNTPTTYRRPTRGTSAGYRPPMPLRNGEHGYGLVTKTVHWGTLLLMAVQFTIGYGMDAEAETDRADDRLDAREDACESENDAAEDRCEDAVDRQEDAVKDDDYTVFDGEFDSWTCMSCSAWQSSLSQ